MKEAKDLSNFKFGKWLVESKSNTTHKHIHWNCVCDCGKTGVIRGSHLLSGTSTSCGCNRKIRARNFKDLSNKKFGRLFVIDYYGKNKYGQTLWNTICDCGNVCITIGVLLSNGSATSCGCYHKERARDSSFKDLTNRKYGMLTVLSAEFKNKNGSYMWLCSCECGGTKITSSSSLVEGKTISCGCLSESFVANKVKQYFVKEYNALCEYRVLRNPDTNNFLPYDLYIETLGMFVEIQGEQHFTENSFTKMGANRRNISPKEMLQYSKRIDSIKKKYAKSNGIYVAVDLRKIKTPEDAIAYIESFI